MMLKLSLKDLIVSRNQILISIAFWTILTPALLGFSVGLYYVAMIFGAFILLLVPMGMDSRDATEILYASLPIKKNAVIFSRYISSVLLTVIIFGWATIVGMLIERYMPDLDIEFIEMISTGGVFVLFCLAVLVAVIIIPVFIKFGFFTSIIIGIFILAAVLSGFILVLSRLILSIYNPAAIENLAVSPVISILTRKDLILLLGRLLGDFKYYITIPFIVAALGLSVFLSFKISAMIYMKKEF